MPFLNQCINVEVMTRTNSIYDHFKCDLDLQSKKNVSMDTSPSLGKRLCQIILKSRHKYRSYGLS